MKKTAVILLMIVFLFNLFGYRLVIGVLQQQSEQQLEALIDQEEYLEEELLEIRVALNMPYQQRFTEYERLYGQVTIEGREYTYVKRKIEGDTLILKCLPDRQRTRLKALANEITVVNTHHDSPKPSPGKSLGKVFKIDGEEPFIVRFAGHSIAGKLRYHSYEENLPATVAKRMDRPPRLSGPSEMI